MDVDDLYDAYLDLCVAGSAPPPEEFLREYPEVHAELHVRLGALFEGMHVPKEDTDLPFEKLGDFRLLRRLDEGGMGSVFIAEQESLGRTVALKIVRAGLRGSEAADRRFEREAQAVARLRHPNLVTLLDAGEEGDVRYLAMEFVPGRRLDDVLAQVALGRETLAPERLLRWVAQLARALAYAHEQGIVHRDVKPSNIRITPDDRPLLLDFGVAHDMAPDAETLTRDFAGSPAYAAPEQLDPRRRVDGRTDVYGLGATLYQCLTGLVPFPGDRVEAVFHRILTEDPVPPRQVKSEISRDLETVVLKAMEKRPSARYAGATAFADDLDAVLAFRPIEARPPGRIARVGKWARRRPGAAVAIVAATLLVLVVGVQWWLTVSERHAEARRLVAEARRTLANYREERQRTNEAERQVAHNERVLYASYTELEDDTARLRFRREAEAQRRHREESFHAVLDLLRQAEQLDPRVRGPDAVRAELYVEKWHEAEQLQDADAEGIYRSLVERFDPAGELVAQFYGMSHLSVVTDPPGADCYLFRYREQAEVVEGGERRMVPVPFGGGPTPVPPGTWTLRVVKGAGEVERGDLIFELCGHALRHTILVGEAVDGLRVGDRLASVAGRSVRDLGDLDERAESGPCVFARAGTPDLLERAVLPRAELVMPRTLAERGGVRARVYRDGEVRELALPRGLEARMTAAPLFVSEDCRLGAAPTAPVRVKPGSYLVLVRSAKHAEQRLPVSVRRGATLELKTRLLPAAARPEGFVFVPARGDEPGFWIMEREVTAGEYLAFLNDAAVQARITASDETILVPRSPQSPPGGDWPRGADGRYALPERFEADFPAFGISWHDAQAYVTWRCARDGRAYVLPTGQHWERAGRGAFEWKYPYGHRFEPKWAKSCFSRRKAWLEPVLSYPVDEAACGAFDMSGSVGEWLDAWWGDPVNRLRPFGGGSWAHAAPHFFRVPGGNGIAPHMAYWMFGLRLVLPGEEPEAEEKR